MYVIIDTSSLLFAMQGRKSAIEAVMKRFDGKEVLISEGLLRELAGIGSGNGKKAASARACLSILKLKNVKVDKSMGNVDRWILARASKEDVYCTVTNDTELFNKLRSKHIAVFKLSKNGMLK